MEPLVHAMHLCTSTPQINELEALTLLKQARVANRKQDVTGMMLYVGGMILLAFEGESRAIGAVRGTLFRDKPRMRLSLLAQESIVEREFPEWTMGFATVDACEAGDLLGDARLFVSSQQVSRLDAEGARTLISIYARRRYQADRSGLYRAIQNPESSRQVGP